MTSSWSQAVNDTKETQIDKFYCDFTQLFDGKQETC